MRISAAPSWMLLLAFLLLGCGGGGSTGVGGGSAGSPPLIHGFSALAPVVEAGGGTVLNWNTSGATTLSIPGVGTYAAAVGSAPVTPSATTTYVLTASNASGSAVASATVTVQPPPPVLPVISSFTVSPEALTSGQNAVLAWTTAGAASLSISPGVGSVAGASGTSAISPASTTTYTLTAANAAGTVTRSATVTVDYRIEFQSGPGGSLAGIPAQSVAFGASSAPVSAVPNPGYAFAGWTGTGGFSSMANPLVLTGIAANQTVTAHFGPATFTVAFVAGAGGNLVGPLSQTIAFGGSCAAVTAVPSPGFRFSSWTSSGFITTASNPLVVTDVTSNLTITAIFGPDNPTVTFGAEEGGSVTGSLSQTVAYGGSCTAVTANPSLGRAFVNWTGTGGFTSTANPLTLGSVTANMAVTAHFAPLTFTVHFLAGPGGDLTGTASQTVAYGAACTAVTANAGTGYAFVNWTGSGGFLSTANPLGLGNVTADRTVTANFAPQTFTVTFTAGTGGSLTGAISQVVAYGAACSAVTAVPLSGYALTNWTGSGFTASAANPLTVGNVTANLAIKANFLAPAPSVASFLPASGGVGSSVVLTGTYLLGATSVSFHGAGATAFTVNSSTQMTATVPPGATSGAISVTTPGGTGTSAGIFTVNTSTLDLTVAAVYLTQATQSIDPSTGGGTVPLVKDRAAYLRAFVVANQANTAAPHVRARIYDAGGALLQTYTLAAPGAAVPQSVNEGSLAGSWNQLVPATLIQPGNKLLVDADPANAILESDEGNNAWPASGSPRALDIRALQPFHLTFVPVTTSAGTGNITAGNLASFTTWTKKLHPISSMDLALRGSPMNSSTLTLMPANDNGHWQTVLDELTALRNTDPGGTSRYYYGVVKTNYNAGILGRSWIPGAGTIPTTSYRASVGWDKLPTGDTTAAHELGHAMGRPHAPGCGVAGPDAGWPTASNYAGGLIGAWGLDPSGPTLYNPATTFDHMNYCDPDWVSDYGYKKVLANRELSPIGLPPPAAEGALQTHSLLLWGGIEDGIVELYPAFHVPVEPQPPAPGDHLLTGYDAAGGKVFEVSFNPVEVADSPRPRWGINFTLPMPVEDAARLAELRWTKAGETLARLGGPAPTRAPGGPDHEPLLQVLSESRTRLLWDAALHPMVLVKDRTTGLGIGIGRSGDFCFQTEAEELELHFSDGVQSRARVMHRPRSGD